MYAIVDIETTGGYAANHRITEIAIYHTYYSYHAWIIPSGYKCDHYPNGRLFCTRF